MLERKLLSGTFVYVGNRLRNGSRHFGTDLGSAVALDYATYESPNAPPDRPVVVLHGVLGNKKNWASACRRLADASGHRVVAVDARNHGLSPRHPKFNYPLMAADLEMLLNTLGSKGAFLLGHSMGGRTVMYLSRHSPDLITGMTVADVSPYSLSPSFTGVVKLVRLLRGIEFPDSKYLSVARSHVFHTLEPKIKDPYVRLFLASNVVKAPEGGFTWYFNLESLDENMENLRNFPLDGSDFQKPVLFVCGSESDYLPHSDEAKILKIFPKASFECIPRAGHNVHIDDQRTFVSLVSDFIKEHHKVP